LNIIYNVTDKIRMIKMVNVKAENPQDLSMKFQSVTDGMFMVSLDDEQKQALADFLKVGIEESQKPGKNYCFFPEVHGQAVPDMTVEKLEASISIDQDVGFIQDEVDMFQSLARSYERRGIDVSFLDLGDDPLSEIQASFKTIEEQAETYDVA